MFLYINFTVRQRNISGYIVMLMDIHSLAVLKSLLGEFIERATDGMAS
jgi:chemotaxis protein CheC